MSQLQAPIDVQALMCERGQYEDLEHRNGGHDGHAIQVPHPQPQPQPQPHSPHSGRSYQQASPHQPTPLRTAHSQPYPTRTSPSPPSSASASASRTTSDLQNPRARQKTTGSLQSASTFRPLQTIDQNSPTTGSVSLPFPRPPDGTPSPVRSIYGQHASNTDPPRSPRERLDALLATEASGQGLRDSPPSASPSIPLQSRSDSPSAQTLSSTLSSAIQYRTVSAPNLVGRLPGNTLPAVSSTMGSLQALHRPEANKQALRNSSIDSAISSISSQSQGSTREPGATGGQDMSTLIAAAGSSENLIQHLLKEKQSSAAQNAQLWRLVDKQRAMILGLNKDLERALKDKDRYRKKAKELVSHMPPSTDGKPAEPSGLVAKLNPLDGPDVVAPLRLGSMVTHHGSTEMASSPRVVAPDPIPSSDKLPVSGFTVPINKTATRKSTLTPLADFTLQQMHDSGPQDHGGHEGDSEPQISPTHARAMQMSRQDAAIPDSPLSVSTDSTASVSDRRPSLAVSEGKSSPRSFGAQRAMTRKMQFQHATPTLALTEASPVVERNMSLASTGSSKAPPAPLDLSKPSATPSKHLHHSPPHVDEQSESDYDDLLELDEIPDFERGRRKTREEDDRDRELQAQQESAQRSTSKKESHDKSAKSASTPIPGRPGMSAAPSGDLPSALDGVDIPLPLSPVHRQAIQISPPADLSRLISPEPDSLAAILNQTMGDSTGSLQTRMVSPPPMSPGLPVSPRPTNRPLHSPLPRQPREGSNIGSPVSPPLSPRSFTGGLPLSPRAPKYPIPLPPGTPMSMVSPTMPKREPDTLPSASSRSDREGSPPTAVPAPISSRDGPVPDEQVLSGPIFKSEGYNEESPSGLYRGFMSDDHPGQLLPPRALPAIHVQVASSLLKPSRASVLLGRSRVNEEEAVFTLGIFARADDVELWRVEKDLLSLPVLDHYLRKGSSFSAKLPERHLFTGHAPAKIDARRVALNQYFEAVLATPLDERLAMQLCDFLSIDALAPDAPEGTPIEDAAASNGIHPTEAGDKPRKEGYLTKRGKNFGGWKARFFCLDGPVLRYYDAPDGAHLGTIRLVNAQIGKQSQQGSNASPARESDDPDNQYRHAFLILEPKKKDSSSHVRHVLCAESDVDRDAWVSALVQYIDDQSSEEEPASSRTQASALAKRANSNPPQSRLQPAPVEQKPSRESHVSNAPLEAEPDQFRGVSYEETIQAETPLRGSIPHRRASPPESDGAHAHNMTTQSASSHFSKQISGPSNATVISDPASWGNKPKPLVLDKKETKKRSIWGFKGRSSSDLNNAVQSQAGQTLTQQQHIQRHGPIRAVFGAPLAEATEYSQPVGVDVYLPAVVYRCIEYLDARKASSEEGIFRLSGSNVVIKSLRERFNTEGDVNFLEGEQYYDVHAVASLLKLYLRELPATVLTRELHLDFLQVLEIENKVDKMRSLKKLVHKLPRANHSLLRALSAFLITIVNNSEQNKMTVRNVGIVFSPTLNIPAPVLSMFLNDFPEIFGSDPDDYSPTSPTIAAAPIDERPPPTVYAPSPDDIRSPRRQMFQDLPTPSINQQFSSFPQPMRGGGIGAMIHPNAQGLGQAAYDTGFTPLQPSYEQNGYGADPYGRPPPNRDPSPAPSSSSSPAAGHHVAMPSSSQHLGAPVNTLEGPKYGSLNATLTPTYPQHLGPPTPGNNADNRARRRESSMLMMGMGGSGGLGNRQSSVPQLREKTSGRFTLD